MIDYNVLLEKIKSRGYWRIHFEPINPENIIESPTQCIELIRNTWIDFQGWDFPHFPTSNESYQEIGTGDRFCEALTDFSNHKEFWKMFLSGQFISYVAFPEDWYNEHNWDSKRQQYKDILPNTKLGVYYNAIMLSSQIFEFLSKLAYNGLYYNGVNVNIKLFNTQNRELWGQRKSWETDHYSFKTRSNIIEAFNKEVTIEDILSNSKELAKDCIKNIFWSFNWNPSEEQIKMYQENMVNRK